MKTNRLNIVVLVLIIFATVVIACIICAVAFKIVNGGKSGINNSTNKFTDMTEQYQDIDVSLYEGSMVQGSALIDLIKKVLEEKPYLSVEVYTLDGSTISYNYIYDKEEQELSDQGSYGQTPSASVPENKSDIAYINPMASFLGTTYKNKSGVIVCIRFEQHN